MRYAHYWYGQVTLTPDLTGDIFSLLLTAQAEVCGGDGAGLPEVTAEYIRFNGSLVRGESHEAFALHDGLNDSYCATAAYSYDAVVGATLLRVRHHNPGFDVESDGLWDDDWADARALYEQVFGERPERPTRLAERHGR